MRKALQEMAQEISRSLVHEIESNGGMAEVGGDLADPLLQRIAEEVVEQLKTELVTRGLSAHDLQSGLRRMSAMLEDTAVHIPDNGGHTGGDGGDFPNLKDGKPKYQNVESILRYVEKDDDKGGVKLVIMNFND